MYAFLCNEYLLTSRMRTKSLGALITINYKSSIEIYNLLQYEVNQIRHPSKSESRREEIHNTTITNETR